MANVQALQRQGWYLTSEGIEECVEDGKNSVDDIIKVALDLDLKQIGERHLPEGISRGKLDTVDGPFVLQIQKIRNVTAPKDNEESQAAPPMLKLTLNDGHSPCSAIEMEKISRLGLNTPPGTKVKLLGKVSVNQGFLLLDNTNVKVLGGHVEKLVENWQLKRELAKHTRSAVQSGEGGPPPFVPFGLRHRDRDTREPKQTNRKENFKSLESNKEKKEDTEFEQQRQASIAEALREKDGGQKNFMPGAPRQIQKDKDVAKIVEMGFSAEQANSALRTVNGSVEDAINTLLTGDSYNDKDGYGKGRGRGQGPPGGPRSQQNSDEKGDRRGGRGRKGRNEDDDYDIPSKPSAPATLFDFLTTKMPAKKKKVPTATLR